MSKVIKTIGAILSVICLALIVFLSVKSSVKIPTFIKGADKGAHFLAYIALSFLFFLAFCSPSRRHYLGRNILPFIASAALAFLVGYAIELCQPYFGRSFELLDLAADGIGAALGSLLGLFCVFLMSIIEKHRSER